MATDRIERIEQRRADDETQRRDRHLAARMLDAAKTMNVITAIAAIGAMISAAGLIWSIRQDRQATVESNRAWMGLVSSEYLRELDDPQGPLVKVVVKNYGRTPALDMRTGFGPMAWPLTKQLTGVRDFPAPLGGWARIGETARKGCIAAKPTPGGPLKWPDDQKGMDLMSPLRGDFDVGAIKDGRAIVLAVGCLTYRTYDEIHHTSFCRYATDRRAGAWEFLECPAGNFAD